MSHNMTKPTNDLSAQRRHSLGIRPVWSEFSLSTWRKFGSLATYWAHSKDSDQTGRMLRLIWVFAGRTGHFVGFVILRLSCVSLWFLYVTVMTGWETANKYKIKNSMDQQVYFAAEGTFEPSHEIMILFILRKLILQTHMRSHPVGLDVWFLVGPFVFFYTSCVRTGKALASLRRWSAQAPLSLRWSSMW